MAPFFQLVLVIGDSHLRFFVEGQAHVSAEGPYYLGFFSTPGATAKDLEKDVRNIVIDGVSKIVLLATGNDTTNNTVTQAGEDFEQLLCTVLDCYNVKVCKHNVVVCIPIK